MRNVIKNVFRLCCLVLASPFVLLYLLAGKSNAAFVGIGQLLSLIPEKFGSYIRVAFYRMTLEKCSMSTYIGFGSYFSRAEVEIGENVYISAHCLVGSCRLEDHVGLSPGVQVLSGRRQHEITEIGKPFLQQRSATFEKVTIGENSWIGQCAMIMANVGRQNLIGAGSVVVKDTGDYEVLAGNPARLLKKIA